MKNKILLLLTLIGGVCGLMSRSATAQVDAHFSQYYAYPLWLNPGLTGVMDGDYRITANYKRQWADISNPYETEALSFDTYPYKNLGFGVTVLHQSAGDAGYNYTNALFSAAYRAILDHSQMNVLSIGIQAGVINRRFNPNKLQLGSQWDPIYGYDPGTASGENFNVTSALNFDANFGIVYFNQNPHNKANVFAGVSVYHLSRPHSEFFKKSNARLPMRFNVHGGVKLKLEPRFFLTPQLIYLRQGNAYEITGGLYGQYVLTDQSDFLFGATYRNKDAVVPFIGFHLGDFTMGLSYDVNVSDLKVASMKKGGLEISLSYIRHKKIVDPKFVCPRL